MSEIFHQPGAVQPIWLDRLELSLAETKMLTFSPERSPEDRQVIVEMVQGLFRLLAVVWQRGDETVMHNAVRDIGDLLTDLNRNLGGGAVDAQL